MTEEEEHELARQLIVAALMRDEKTISQILARIGDSCFLDNLMVAGLMVKVRAEERYSEVSEEKIKRLVRADKP